MCCPRDVNITNGWFFCAELEYCYFHKVCWHKVSADKSLELLKCDLQETGWAILHTFVLPSPVWSYFYSFFLSHYLQFVDFMSVARKFVILVPSSCLRLFCCRFHPTRSGHYVPVNSINKVSLILTVLAEW